MKIIDLLNKIANGEINEDTLIEFDNGYKDYCSVKIFFDRYIVDKENLNCEVEIIEDTPKEEKKIEKPILDTDNDVNGSYDIVIINDIKYEINKVNRYILGKICEIIDKINGEENE